jgi:hypothetical protein
MASLGPLPGKKKSLLALSLMVGRSHLVANKEGGSLITSKELKGTIQLRPDR